jgi:hypothetical protein
LAIASSRGVANSTRPNQVSVLSFGQEKNRPTSPGFPPGKLMMRAKKPEATWLQLFLAKAIYLTDACWQRCQPVRLSLQSRRLIAGWLVHRRLTGVDDCSSAISAEHAWERCNHQLGLAMLEGAPDPIQTRMLYLVCQPKVVETIFELGKLLLFALLELFLALSVALMSRVALCEECSY